MLKKIDFDLVQISSLKISLLLFFLFLISLLIYSTPLFGDMAGHFDTAVQIKENFFPDYSGWNANYFLGFQQGLYYPPLFHYLLAILLFIFPQYFAGAISIFLTLGLFLFSSVYLAKSIYQKEKDYLLLAVILISGIFLVDYIFDLSFGAPGVSYTSTIYIGLLPAALVISPIFLFLAFFNKYLNLKNKKYFYASIIFLIISLLTHFSGYILIIFLIVSLIFYKKERIDILKILLFSIFGVSFWLIPFLFYSKYIPKAVFLPNLTIEYITLLLFSNLFIIFTKNKFIKVLGVTNFILTLLILSVYTLQLPFQIFRLIPLTYFFSVILIFSNIPIYKNNIIKKLLSIIFSLLLILFLFNANFPSSTNISIENDVELTGNTLILANMHSWFDGLHATPTEFVKITNNNSVMGLFTESTNNSQISFIISRYFQENYPCWGVICFTQKRTPQDVIQKQLNLFNINQVILEFDSPKLAGFKSEYYMQTIETKIEKEFFIFPKKSTKTVLNGYIYFIDPENEIKEVEIPEKVIGLKVNDFDEWTAFISEWIFLADNTIYFLADNNFEINTKEKINAEIIKKETNKIELFVDSNTPKPIFLKVSWSPNWNAYDQNGEKIPIFIASPYNMGLIGNGKITLKNELTFVEVIFRWISFVTLIILMTSLLKYIMKKKSGLKSINKEKIFEIKNKIFTKNNVFLLLIFIVLAFLLIQYGQSKNILIYNEALTQKSITQINEELFNNAKEYSLEEIFTYNGNITCTFKNNDLLFINGTKVLAITNEGEYYYNKKTIKNSLGIIDLNFETKKTFFANFKNPLTCELNSTDKFEMDKKIIDILEEELS